MDWIKLDLSKASLIKKEVDIALNTLTGYVSGNDPNKLMNFVGAIQSRIHEMDSFCNQNSEDERVMLVEKQRLRLRTAIQAYVNPENVRRTSYSVMSSSQKEDYNRSVGATSNSGGAPAQGPSSQPPQPPPPGVSSNGLGSRPQPPPPPVAPPGTPYADGRPAPPPAPTGQPPGQPSSSQTNNGAPSLQTPDHSPQKPPRGTTPNYPTHVTLGGGGGAHSVISITNNNSTKKKGPHHSPPKSPSKIYAWEDPAARQERCAITVDDVGYVPSKQAGFYHMPDDLYGGGAAGRGAGRGGLDDSHSVGTGMTGATGMPNGARYVDFQIVLTADELQALAARKKAARQDVKLYKQTFSAKNVHHATPYVDPKRINIFRQDTPEKWVDKKGLRPALKRGML